MIDIQHSHQLPEATIRQLVQSLADKLADRLEVDSHWAGDRLAFQRSGVEGVIELLPGRVRVTATLGFPYSMMQSMVEEEIRRMLAEKLG